MFATGPLFAVLLLLALVIPGLAEPEDCPGGQYCFCDPNSLMCLLCQGYYGTGVGCRARNETFTEDKLQTDANSGDTIYTGFTVQQMGPNNPIIPSSPPHMLRTSSAGYGRITFDLDSTFENYGGKLAGFHYACADPVQFGNHSIYGRNAVACTISINASVPAHDYGEYGNGFPYLIHAATFTYTPGPERYPAMVDSGYNWVNYTDTTPPSIALYNFDWNFYYEFTATQMDGSPAFLYLDSLIFGVYYGYNYY